MAGGKKVGLIVFGFFLVILGIIGAIVYNVAFPSYRTGTNKSHEVEYWSVLAAAFIVFTIGWVIVFHNFHLNGILNAGITSFIVGIAILFYTLTQLSALRTSDKPLYYGLSIGLGGGLMLLGTILFIFGIKKQRHKEY